MSYLTTARTAFPARSPLLYPPQPSSPPPPPPPRPFPFKEAGLRRIASWTRLPTLLASPPPPPAFPLGKRREMCGGGVTCGEHGDVASHAERRGKVNWRAMGEVNHVDGDWMSDKLVFGGDNMVGGKEKLVPSYWLRNQVWSISLPATRSFQHMPPHSLRH